MSVCNRVCLLRTSNKLYNSDFYFSFWWAGEAANSNGHSLSSYQEPGSVSGSLCYLSPWPSKLSGVSSVSLCFTWPWVQGPIEQKRWPAFGPRANNSATHVFLLYAAFGARQLGFESQSCCSVVTRHLGGQLHVFSEHWFPHTWLADTTSK